MGLEGHPLYKSDCLKYRPKSTFGFGSSMTLSFLYDDKFVKAVIILWQKNCQK